MDFRVLSQRWGKEMQRFMPDFLSLRASEWFSINNQGFALYFKPLSCHLLLLLSFTVRTSILCLDGQSKDLGVSPRGFPGGAVVENLPCQCRGHGFEPWSGKIPHAAEQLGPWATITELACLEPVLRNKRGHDSERPAHHDEEWPPLATTRESPRTETKTQHSHK